MNNNTKYIFVVLKERSGEYEYSHRSVHELADSETTTAGQFAENYLKGFYGGNAKAQDGGYYFYNEEISVEISSWSFLNEATFNVLNKYL